MSEQFISEAPFELGLTSDEIGDIVRLIRDSDYDDARNLFEQAMRVAIAAGRTAASRESLERFREFANDILRSLNR